MKKSKIWIKYINYFIIGFLIFIIIFSIIQIDLLKSFNMNVKTSILHIIQSGIVLYTILYFLIFISNMLYNIRLIKNLNKESEKIRKLNNDKILKERRGISMKRKVLIILLIITLLFLTIFILDIIRKSVILEKYSEAVISRRNYTNYYVKYIIDNTETYEMLRKGNIKMEKNINENGTVHMLYQESENEYYILIETASGEKIGFKNSTGEVPTFNGGDTYFSIFYESNHNWLDKLKLILNTNITTEELNGKKCYRLYTNENLQVYVNKEDLVALKTVNGQTVEYIEYSFDTVSDENIEIPNLEEYSLKYEDY